MIDGRVCPPSGQPLERARDAGEPGDQYRIKPLGSNSEGSWVEALAGQLGRGGDLGADPRAAPLEGIRCLRRLMTLLTDGYDIL